MTKERPSHVCNTCDGMGWVGHGYLTAPMGAAIFDVAVYDWRPCPTCSGQRYYVGRAEAGLAATD